MVTRGHTSSGRLYPGPQAPPSQGAGKQWGPAERLQAACPAVGSEPFPAGALSQRGRSQPCGGSRVLSSEARPSLSELDRPLREETGNPHTPSGSEPQEPPRTLPGNRALMTGRVRARACLEFGWTELPWPRPTFGFAVSSLSGAVVTAQDKRGL